MNAEDILRMSDIRPKTTIHLSFIYDYKGSSNCSLSLVEYTNGEVHLVTDFGETIASVRTGEELLRILSDLNEGKYAW